jgi:hypothetical protein
MKEDKLAREARRLKMQSQRAAILGNLDGLTALVRNKERREKLLGVRKDFLETMK